MKTSKLLFFLSFCFVSNLIFSYSKGKVNVDSVLSRLKDEKNDSIIAKNNLLICEYYLGDDNSKAAYYAKLGLKHSLKSEYKKGIALAYNSLALANVYSSKNYIAIDYFTKAYKVFKEINDLKQVAGILNNIGILHENESNYTKAIEYYFRALKINEQNNFFDYMGANLNGIASVYGQQKDMQKALIYFKKAYQINKKIKNLSWQSINLSNIGAVYYELKQFDVALSYFMKAYSIDKKLNDPYNLSLDYINIAAIKLEKKEFEQSLFFYREAIKLNKKIENLHELITSYYGLANLYFDKYKNISFDRRTNIKTAESYADSSLKLAIKMNNLKMMSDNYFLKSKFDSINSNYQSGLENFKLYARIKDSIFNSDKKSKFTQITMQHDFDQKEAKIKFEHDKKIVENKNKLNLVILALCISLVFLTIVFLQRNKIKKEKKIVDEKKAIIEAKNLEILESITYAKRIQSAILPQPKLVKEFLEDSFILYKPKDIVAGDFYWLEVVGETVLFAAADCTGHGVPGAMVSVVCNNGLNRAVREEKLISPDLILNKTRELVVEEFEKSDENVMDGMDISLCALNIQTNQLKWAGANNPLWIIRNKEILEYKPDKQPIGKYSNAKPFTLVEVQLQKNDTIYIFTDGLQDQFGGDKGKKYKAAQMRELFLSLSEMKLEEQRKIIDEKFETWKGHLEQVDDVCVIGVRV